MTSTSEEPEAPSAPASSDSADTAREPLVTSAEEPLLLDSYLGEYDVAEVHACIVNGDVQATWEAIRKADLSSIPVVHWLLVLRSLPGRLRALKKRPGGTRSTAVQPC
jgi:hypothetical protein